MPQPKKDNPAPEETPAALETGQHNPYLEGLIAEGEKCEEAIKSWYKRRETLRSSARDAVKTGFASDEQAKRVEELWPFPKRKDNSEKKEDAS